MEKKPKKKVGKLVLRKETLLLLEEGALKEVAGGSVAACPSRSVVTDCCCHWH